MRQKRENKIKTFVKSIKNTKKWNVMLLWNHRNVNFKSLSRTVFTKNGSIKCTEHFLLVSYSLRCSESESCSVMTPWTIQSMEFSRPEYWCGWSFLSPGDLPNPGIEPRSPALQTYSLPAEPPGKPKNTGVGSLSLLQQTFPTQELNQGLLHYRQIRYRLSYQGSPCTKSFLFL